MAKVGYVYIITNKPDGVLYVGVTSDILRRIFEHKQQLVEGFSSRYHLDTLVWYEEFPTIAEAIVCEKRIKKWKRDWKIRVIEETNPAWADLYPSLTHHGSLPPQG